MANNNEWIQLSIEFPAPAVMWLQLSLDFPDHLKDETSMG
jgi:hypothetical protein